MSAVKIVKVLIRRGRPLFFALLLSFALSGCFGTESGNPTAVDPGTENPCLVVTRQRAVENLNAGQSLDQVMSAVCQRWQACQPGFDWALCPQSLNDASVNPLLSVLGFAQTIQSTASARALLVSGAYEEDGDVTVCSQGLAVADCSFFPPPYSQPFNQLTYLQSINSILPMSCSDLYREDSSPSVDPGGCP